MSIYTRRGDRGDTSLADGSRVRKADPRVEAYGAIDEAGSAIGLARVTVTDPDLADVLRFAQQRLRTIAFGDVLDIDAEPGRGRINFDFNPNLQNR